MSATSDEMRGQMVPHTAPAPPQPTAAPPPAARPAAKWTAARIFPQSSSHGNGGGKWAPVTILDSRPKTKVRPLAELARNTDPAQQLLSQQLQQLQQLRMLQTLQQVGRVQALAQQTSLEQQKGARLHKLSQLQQQHAALQQHSPARASAICKPKWRRSLNAAAFLKGTAQGDAALLMALGGSGGSSCSDSEATEHLSSAASSTDDAQSNPAVDDEPSPPSRCADEHMAPALSLALLARGV